MSWDRLLTASQSARISDSVANPNLAPDSQYDGCSGSSFWLSSVLGPVTHSFTIWANFWHCGRSGSSLAVAPAVGPDSHYDGCSCCGFSVWLRSVLRPVTHSFTICADFLQCYGSGSALALASGVGPNSYFDGCSCFSVFLQCCESGSATAPGIVLESYQDGAGVLGSITVCLRCLGRFYIVTYYVNYVNYEGICETAYTCSSWILDIVQLESI